MNGRVYDPNLGRFLTPDPHVQSIGDPQSYNRYSYVLNNPLRYSDPTGYFAWGSFGANAWMGLVETAIIAGACATGAGCAIAILAFAAEQAYVMHTEGASWSQVATATAINTFAGIVGGGVGSAIGGALGGGLTGTLVGGAIGGTVGAAYSSALSGQSIGWNTLVAAAEGAEGGGIHWGYQSVAPVSQASAATGQAGGGSGEAQLQLQSMHSFLDSGGYQLQNPTAGWGLEQEPGGLSLLADDTGSQFANMSPGCIESTCGVPMSPASGAARYDVPVDYVGNAASLGNAAATAGYYQLKDPFNLAWRGNSGEWFPESWRGGTNTEAGPLLMELLKALRRQAKYSSTQGLLRVPTKGYSPGSRAILMVPSWPVWT